MKLSQKKTGTLEGYVTSTKKRSAKEAGLQGLSFSF